MSTHPTGMDNITTLAAADLFVLLDREYRRRCPRECADCSMSLPYFVEPDGESPSNWDIIMPPPCPARCVDIMERIVADFRERYRLRPARAGEFAPKRSGSGW